MLHGAIHDFMLIQESCFRIQNMKTREFATLQHLTYVLTAEHPGSFTANCFFTTPSDSYEQGWFSWTQVKIFLLHIITCK